MKNAAKPTLLQCLSKIAANLLFIETFHKCCKENAAKQKLYCIVFKKRCNREIAAAGRKELQENVAKNFPEFFWEFYSVLWPLQ